MVLLEVCVDDAEGLRAALRGGAQRIELCAELGVGGLTPPPELLRIARAEAGDVPIFSMLRPRGGDFVYTPGEVDVVRRQLDGLLELGVDGVVFGALERDGALDQPLLAEIRSCSGQLPLTFHRAFDEARDPLAARAWLGEGGWTRILTSGGPGAATLHLDTLADWIARTPKSGPAILVGGGVRAHNVRAIVEATGAREVHSSAGLEGRTDEAEVRRLRAALAG